MRSANGRNRLQDRLNPERVQWFQQKHAPSRSGGYLARLVASDDFFHRQTLNSYSESWAFTFFALENASRQRNFVKYLKTLSERDSSDEYSARERLQDFESAFGDLSRLEVEFLRYMQRTLRG